jgi:hypothetical protein
LAAAEAVQKPVGLTLPAERPLPFGGSYMPKEKWKLKQKIECDW